MILPPLNTLQAFEAAARHSSLSKAGDELNITHAAISGQMKRLEDWMGRKLFERSGRGVVLTPAGLELYKTVAPSLSSIALVSQSLRRRKDKKSLTVACVPSIAARWLIPALPEFAEVFPDIEIHVSYATAFQEFDPEMHDILINNRSDVTDAAEVVKLFSRINKPVASPDYLRRTGVDERLNGAHLLYDETVADWEEWFAKAELAPTGLTRGPIYQDFNLLSTAVIAGHGVTLCPVEVFRREIMRGDLIVLSDIAILDDQGYYLISEKQSNRLVSKFCQWLLTVCVKRDA
ncbi:transcriptional regulator [Pseudomonas sp. GM49]|uniref:LysR family transcriptional regulator n=1 Tax=Pseudomonas sp. GM49 TaxID=1144331 RepID=UPI00026FDC1D|nr:LysR family transcriptional regulator [Pseudomonas sp. GM49]EJM67413.1 transcriptional regulator [Pseudomonas sp. GM49]